MADANEEYHFAIGVRCKRLEIPQMNWGKWMVMHIGKDFDEMNRRWRIAREFLKPLGGELVVYKIDANNIGRVWVLGLFGVRNPPPLADVIPATDDLKHGFWRRAGMETGFLDRRRPAAPQQRNWKNWFAPA